MKSLLVVAVFVTLLVFSSLAQQQQEAENTCQLIGYNLPYPAVWDGFENVMVKGMAFPNGIVIHISNAPLLRNNTFVALIPFEFERLAPLRQLGKDLLSSGTTCVEKGDYELRCGSDGGAGATFYFSNPAFQVTVTGCTFEAYASFTIAQLEASVYVIKSPSKKCPSGKGTDYLIPYQFVAGVPGVVGKAFAGNSYPVHFTHCFYGDKNFNASTTDADISYSVKNGYLVSEIAFATEEGNAVINAAVDPSSDNVKTAEVIYKEEGKSLIYVKKPEPVPFDGIARQHMVEFTASVCKNVNSRDSTCEATWPYFYKGNYTYKETDVFINEDSPGLAKVYCGYKPDEIVTKEECSFLALGASPIYLVIVFPQSTQVFHITESHSKLFIGQMGQPVRQEFWQVGDVANYTSVDALPSNIDPKLVELAKKQLVFLQVISQSNHLQHLMETKHRFSMTIHVDYDLNKPIKRAASLVGAKGAIVNNYIAAPVDNSLPWWSFLLMGAAGSAVCIVAVALVAIVLVKAVKWVRHRGYSEQV